ncbi:MAG: hypothetical protein U0P30_17405 [Vicinamibacterales bacterium]
MRGSFRLYSSLVFTAAVAFAAAPAHAQESRSASAAQELAQVLGQKKMDAVAARDPNAPDQFIAALAFPGQLIVISAKYPAPPLLNEKIAQNNHRDAYIELNSASVPESRFVITDLGADGLKAKKAKKDDLAVDSRDAGGKSIRFDGNWKEDKMSEADYMKAFNEADEHYARVLAVLVAAAKK